MNASTFTFTLITWLIIWPTLSANESVSNRQRDAQTSRPNLIFILADDLGYGDLGCYGQQRIETPHLDRMASEGMRFTDFYAGSTVCAPSRCVLMTGYHTGHCFIRGNGRISLREKDLTLAEILKAAGYATCLSGKWGLGEENSSGVPNRQGFDEFFGYLNQRHAHNYFPTFLMQNQRRVPLNNKVPNEGKFGEGKAVDKRQYSHDLIVEHALEFIAANADQPFFLYLALTIPHANNEAGNEGMEVPDYGVYSDLDWPEPQKGHAAMISRMDRDCGRIFELLQKLNIDRQTLVLFSSDNGPHREGGNRPEFNDSNGPLSGIKRSLGEGGIRVPMLARWPGQISAGTHSSFVGCFQDIMPTFAQLAGATGELPADIDGISFAPTLMGEADEQRQHDLLFWAFFERGGGRAGRAKNWKILQQPIHSPPRLYDLSTDLSEQHDLSGRHPEVVDELVKRMDLQFVDSPDWRFPEPKKQQK